MQKKYDHLEVEKRWQKFWKEKKAFKASDDTTKSKYYVLDMFPYPSGTGLHVGHAVGYTATDILARYKRQMGFNVLHPIGWDSFGLPAEQYAVRTGTHPGITTKNNIDNFRRQLQELGYSYDWDREFATSDPSYYKWTQWIFTKLYEKGLAYEADMFVNYCPALGTVLANEEVENGKSKEGGHPIERKALRQWVLKITAYAERLIKDLDLVDWPESLKKLQINWIGKSEGATIRFCVDGTSHQFEVYTTRPDTLGAVTFMVLAPEHPLVNQIATQDQQSQVKDYQTLAASKKDLDRMELTKEKSGVFTGAYAINPLTHERVPIWVADYVIMGYGTGAVMGVAAHDERDFEFATAFHLPITPIFIPDLEKYPENIPQGMSHNQVKELVALGKICWTGEGEYIDHPRSEIQLKGLDFEKALHHIVTWLEKSGHGKGTTSYKLRDWLFSRQRYWGEPFPILHFEDGTKRILNLDELPLVLPEVPDYKPSPDGQSPLSKARSWIEVVDPKTGKKALRETNTMPNWAGSCWYYLRFADPHNEKAAWDKKLESYWLPVDLYVGGVEHAVLHLLYARFWHKVLYDCGLVSSLEPFQTLRNQGLLVAYSYQRKDLSYVPPEEVEERDGKYYERKTGEILSSQIDKMSKSKLNGVSPDEIIEEYGADALRLYVMFLGPLEKEKLWNSDAVSGCKRFINRMYDLVVSEKLRDEESEEANKLTHRLVHGVKKDIESLQFNTAIAKMMEFINDFSRLPFYPKSQVKKLPIILSSFAPHLAEEMWSQLKCEGSLSHTPFPQIDEKYLEDALITYVVQVNGKLRGRFDLPKDQSQEVILEAAKNHPSISKFLEGSELQKVVFVPNKLLNLVVKS